MSSVSPVGAAPDGPADPGESARAAVHLLEVGRTDDAERRLRAALAEHPGHPALLGALSRALLTPPGRADRHAEGIAAAEALCAVAPEHEYGHRLRGLHLMHTGRHAEATESGYRAATLAPDQAPPAMAYAQILSRAGRRHDARQVARRAVALDPQRADAHVLLAGTAQEAGDRVTARAAYAEALRLDPAHAVARHDLAVLDLRRRRAGRALAGLIDAGRLAPDEPHLLPNVAAVVWQLAWWLRILLLVGVFVVVGVWSATDGAPLPGRLAAAGVLLAAAGLARWITRGVPRSARPVLRAAVRRDAPLRVTVAGLGLALLLYLAVLVTGVGLIAAGVWVVLLVLAVLAVVVGLVRR